MEIPKNLSPKQVFEEFLPAEFARRGISASDDIAVRMQLWGDGGGEWQLKASGSTLQVTPDPTGDEPLLTVIQTVEDWKALALGDDAPDAIPLAPTGTSPLDGMLLDPATRRTLTAVKGTFRFDVSGYRGRTWMLTIKLGSQPMAVPPDAVIAMAAPDYGAMNAGKLNPAEAFFQGKVKITGNQGLAMQLGMAMLPRFQTRSPGR